MEILKVNYPIGSKCYTRFGNAFRECIFLGTKGAKNKRGVVDSFYVLNIAGYGTTLIEFDRFGQFDSWYHGSKCNTTLYPTLDDCMRKTNPITAMYGSTSNCYNGGFMQPFFNDCSVCNVGGSIHGWVWNGTDAVQVYCAFSSAEYCIDADGFHHNGVVESVGYIGRLGMCRGKKVYKTKNACMADNEALVVTF